MVNLWRWPVREVLLYFNLAQLVYIIARLKTRVWQRREIELAWWWWWCSVDDNGYSNYKDNGDDDGDGDEIYPNPTTGND